MPALLQLWIVIVTMGLLAAAIVTAYAVTKHVRKVADDLSRLALALTDSAEQITVATREVQALVASVQGCVVPIQRVAERFAGIGQRTATVSSLLLEGIEGPVFTAAAVSTGVKSAAVHLVKRLMHRFTQRNSSINGDRNHE